MRIQIAMVALAALTVSTPAMARGERTSGDTRVTATARAGTALQRTTARRSAQATVARRGARAAPVVANAVITPAQHSSSVTGITSSFTNISHTSMGNETTISFNNTLEMGDITEFVTFTNALAGMTTITFGTSSPDVDFSSVILTGTGLAEGGISLQDFIVGSNEQFALEDTFLNAGTFTLTAIGTNSGVGSAAGTITIRSQDAVPEPGTWAMMLLGFGAAGVGLRRSRRQNAKLLQIA